jgi:WD40 repeat protein
VREIAGTSLTITVSLGGRVILWSGRQRKQMGYFDAEGDISCADINNKNNVLAVGTSDGLLQFYSISSFDSPFLFKEIRLTKGHAIAQISFSSSGE